MQLGHGIRWPYKHVLKNIRKYGAKGQQWVLIGIRGARSSPRTAVGEGNRRRGLWCQTWPPDSIALTPHEEAFGHSIISLLRISALAADVSIDLPSRGWTTSM